MRWSSIGYVAVLLTLLLCLPVLAVDETADYHKIARVHIDYKDASYTVTSIDLAYGKAPNLNLREGDLKGVILGPKGVELRTFAIMQPGVSYGDIVSPDGDLISYSGSSTAGSMTLTIPYLQNMQEFRLIDTRDGSVLLTADLDGPVSTFCSDYSQDPECLVRINAMPGVSPRTTSATLVNQTYLALAVLFAVSLLIAIGIALFTVRKRVLEAKTPRKKTVLIVDDDPDIVDIIQILLENRGFTTITASNGQGCLNALKKQIPDLILLDIMMEPMDGWETLEQIKKSPEYGSIPILMLTGKSLTPAEAQKYRICIHDYIMKPFRMDDLNAAINSVLERREKLNKSLVLAKQAGLEREMICELDSLTRRISVNRKMVDLLNIPMAVPMQADLDTLDDMLVVDYLNVNTRMKEKRVEELKQQINTAFRSKGLPDFSW